jgi:hypothetical protein
MPIDTNGKQNNSYINKTQAIFNLLQLLPKDKINFLIYPIPEIGCDIYNMHLSFYKNTGNYYSELSFGVDSYDSRNEFVVKAFSEFNSNFSSDHIIPIKTRSLFCDSFKKGSCAVIHDSIPLYIDADHVSDYGASLIVREIITQLESSLIN